MAMITVLTPEGERRQATVTNEASVSFRMHVQ
jgi:hypothetical protein